MKNLIYEFYGCTALDDAEKFITQCLALGINSSCIDMMQDSDLHGSEESVVVGIAVYATLYDHLKLNAYTDKLMSI